MSTNALPDRPNTVSGLNAKREELIRYRKQLRRARVLVDQEPDHVGIIMGPADIWAMHQAAIAHREALDDLAKQRPVRRWRKFLSQRLRVGDVDFSVCVFS